MYNHKLTEREDWLISRIGKRVYRPPTNCSCGVCANVVKNGLMITDRDHALYLSEMEFEYTSEGIPIQYFDTPEEVEAFIKNNPA